MFYQLAFAGRCFSVAIEKGPLALTPFACLTQWALNSVDASKEKEDLQKPLLERLGVRYFARRSRGQPAAVGLDAVHVLNETERLGLKQVERGAMLRAAAVGALSAALAAGAEVLAEPLVAADGSSGQLHYWLVVGSVTLAATVIEIALIYWDTLRSVHRLSQVAGLQLFEDQASLPQQAVADALARAALELPNPIQGPLGIHARKEASRLKYVLASLAYKAKVGLTNFLFKLLVRRILSRVAVRSLSNMVLPFVAVPVTAVWNAIVSFRVLREARIRAMGPSASEEALNQLWRHAVVPSPLAAEAMVRAVASAIVRTEDCHPNLLALLSQVRLRNTMAQMDQPDNVSRFLKSLTGLSAVEKTDVLAVLVLACVVDGRFSSREARLCREAFSLADFRFDRSAIEVLRQKFIKGEGVELDALRLQANANVTATRAAVSAR